MRINNIYNNYRKLDVDIFLFGSILYTNSPNDIDILILYPISTSYIDKIFELRDNIKMILEKELSIDIDILILSYEEEKEIEFIQNEKAIKLNIL